MPRKVSYSSAAMRHYQDAEFLFDAGRIPNAGQLYGFIAECGIKSLLIWNGYDSDPTTGEITRQKNKNDNLRVHIHELVQRINTVKVFLNGRSGAKYLNMIPNIENFHDWDTNHRYYIDSEIPPSVPTWKMAAKEVIEMLEQAKLDGMQE
jgi:hypothetical protein